MLDARRTTKRAALALACWLAATAAAAGCSAHGAARAAGRPPAALQEQPLVELFSWWTAPGEAEALRALTDAHKSAYPSARLFNAAAASGAQAKERLHRRLADGDPPDLFQENAHDLRTSAGKDPRLLVPLDDTFDALGLRDVVFPEVLADVTIGGHVVAMPVNIHRENALFYNKAIFDAHHLAPPTTVDEFLATCEKLKQAGVTPVATAYQGWILRLMFNSIAMGKMGAGAYRDYFTTGRADLVPALRDAILVFKTVLESYVNDDASEDGFNWTNAAQAVYSGDAAMFMHGDWAKGYLMQLGWRPGVDFGVVGAPGAADLFLYGVDVFAIPRGAQNERGAREFLETIASKDAQVAFNRIKGSSPIRMDAPTEQLDPLARATLADLRAARVRMLVRSRPAWDDAIGRFARTRDVDALVRAFVDEPPG